VILLPLRWHPIGLPARELCLHQTGTHQRGCFSTERLRRGSGVAQVHAGSLLTWGVPRGQRRLEIEHRLSLAFEGLDMRGLQTERRRRLRRLEDRPQSTWLKKRGGRSN
jgi:hypothetical protein